MARRIKEDLSVHQNRIADQAERLFVRMRKRLTQ